jgi:hypothetical protein
LFEGRPEEGAGVLTAKVTLLLHLLPRTQHGIEGRLDGAPKLADHGDDGLALRGVEVSDLMDERKALLA